MRKRTKRVIRRACAPTLVAMNLNPQVFIQERQAVNAFRGGWATADHFNLLNDTKDLLVFAAAEKRDNDTMAICNLAWVALANISDRYKEQRKMGATGDELRALDLLCDASEDFWKRQPGSLFVDAEAALIRSREMFKEAA